MAFLGNCLPPHCVSLTSHHLNHHFSSNYSSFFSIYFTLQPKFNNLNGKNSSFLCLAYSKKTRPSRKLMSDEELCNRLKEFVASVGLPEGHVPSTKKLTEHGRNDLANIVRRRGHKLIADLLANATIPTTDEYDSQENLNEKVDRRTYDEEIGQEEKVVDSIEESVVSSDNERRFSLESPVSLQEKVEHFMKYGQLDAVESNGTLMIERSISLPTTEESEIHLEISNETIMQGNKMDNEDEVNRLKLMLHQKELELSRLKEEIAKEKKELTILQTKAEDEISKAQKLITEKEAELLAAEESLSGLVEAKIQYSGDGETVEVAGSFNGWHQRIQLDLQISSVIVDPSDSRLSKLWAATLWLYPGVYEMKFVVDGKWKIDPQREITIKNGVENNILRVDR